MINWPRTILYMLVAAFLMALGGAIIYYVKVVPMQRDVERLKADMANAITVSAQAQLDEVSLRQERERIANEKWNKGQLFVNDLIAGIGGSSGVQLDIDKVCGGTAPKIPSPEDRNGGSRVLSERVRGIYELREQELISRLIRADKLNLDARRANVINGFTE